MSIRSVVLISLALISAVVAQEYPKVTLNLYYEAGCPYCQDFIDGPLTNALALPDIVAITDFKMVPYGNTKKNTDGTFTCQHGTDECLSDIYQQCALYKLSGNITSIESGDTSLAAFPFVQCMEQKAGAPSSAESCFASTLKVSSTLAWSTVQACYDTEGVATQNEGATATVAHDYVPWVVVDDTLLEYTELLIPAICMAYTGPAPASCTKALQSRTNKKVSINN